MDDQDNEEAEEEATMYEGTKDEDGLPHGRGTLTFINTEARFEGRFFKGKKTGRGCFYFPDGSSLTGFYVSNVLEGRAVYNYPDGRMMVSEWVSGKLNGPFTEYAEDGSVVLCGHHEDDKRTGYLKMFDDFGGVFWGELDENESLTGQDISYIYPDLYHVLYGQFSDGILKQARWGVLNGSIDSSILNISMDSQSTDVIHYDKSSHDHISKFPLIADKYEQEKVYVSESSIASAGEGLFAKKWLTENTVVSFYNGVRLSHEEVDARDWSFNEYTITLDDEVVLDVPKEFVKLEKYCATLGHKANHFSVPNCEYMFYHHPRFGEIKAIKTICDVHKDTELTCDYGYCHKHVCTGEDDVPSWYIQL